MHRIPYDTYSSYWEKGCYYHRLEYTGPGFILIFRSGKAVLKPEARLFRIMVNDEDSGLKGIVPGTSTWVAVLQIYGYHPDAEDSSTWIYSTKGLGFGVDSVGLVNSIILFRPDEDYVELITLIEITPGGAFDKSGFNPGDVFGHAYFPSTNVFFMKCYKSNYFGVIGNYTR